jgi:hypothetical protein
VYSLKTGGELFFFIPPLNHTFFKSRRGLSFSLWTAPLFLINPVVY